MKGRQAAIVLGTFLGALGTQGLWAGDNDRAVPRGGGSSGGSSGGGHHSSGGSSGGSSSSAGAHHHSGGSSSSGSSDSGSSARAPRTDAQRRHPQPGTGSGRGHGGYHGGYYGGRYYGSYYPYYSYYPYNDFYWGYGFYFSPFYYPRYSGFSGGYYGPGYGYGYGGYGGYHRGYYDRSGSVRVIVEPNEAKVYVDNYYAGTADDFDGVFQRLNLTPGRHDIALKLEGYETHKVKLYVPLDHTIKIKHAMVRGAADHVTESSVGDPADEERYARRANDDRDQADDGDDRYEPRDRAPDRYEPQDRAPDRYEPQDQGERRDDSQPPSRERGTLRLEVSPADASIYVDGMFRGTGDDLRRLNLPVGRHKLEVVRPGYRTLERDVEVQAGETEDVDVDLPRS